MVILHRYITRKFMQILLFAIVGFISIFVIVDLIENLDTFINNEYPTEAVIDFYLNYIPFILVLVLPVAMLISALFSVGNLARQNEIVAMKAAGISLYRIFLPIFVISILVSFIAMGVANYLVPRATERQSDLREQYEKNRSRQQRLDNIYIRDEQDRRITMRYFNVGNNTGNTVSIRTFESDSLKSRIDAKKITWQDSLWLLQTGYERYFTSTGEIARSFDQKKFRSTTLLPDNIAKQLKIPEEMSYSELKDFIREVERNGANPDRWRVDLYLKIALPFANFIIVLFGTPLSSAQTRRSGAAKGFGISLAVTFVYFGILKTTQAMGHNGKIEPLLAAWFANVVFGVIGVFVLIRAKK
ncbi:LPS export ABC transporter permease LptG [candidate division KSB1 bacterium]|nr:LPS export ABC transporter permease LptG [candidate division KSB1 bacterium]